MQIATEEYGNGGLGERNLGSSPVLDIEFTEVLWTDHPILLVFFFHIFKI